MKKVTKALITAATVAAVVGVGGVSFAAWQAGDASSDSVSGTSGSIVVFGSLTAEDDLNGKSLVPYDQEDEGDQYDESTMALEMTITLRYTGGTGTPTITMTASGTLASNLEWENGSDNWEKFDEGVPVTTGDIKIRLNSDSTSDMNQDWKIEFEASAE